MKRLLALAAVLAVAAGVLYVVPSDHYLFLPDRARPVDALVSIEEEELEADDGTTDEGVYMVDILVRRASLLERLIPELADGATLVPGHAVNPIGVSDTQRRQTSLNQMSRSQEVAVAVALEALGYVVDVEDEGAEVTTVLPDRPADGILEVGDIVIGAAGTPVRRARQLQAALADVRPGEEVGLTIVRDGKEMKVTVGTMPSEDDPNRAVMGVLIEQAATFDFPLEIEIDAGDIGGPSAGLAFALGITDELGDELTCGRRITVTGELDLEGNVGAIGGVKQKAIGADQSGADIFVVPEGNAIEAREHAPEELEVIAVSTYAEAVDALEC
ncbi:MAG TPA: S16 family serine protease [Gaiellaceae bacterium]|nr:S16 family serine protease [Gaiellaceae bacterium]